MPDARPNHPEPSDSLARYQRQMLLPQLGEAGQQRLLASRAVIVGCGALGSPAAELLCRAGVGELVLIDRDIVELSNLHRQTLYDEADAREALPKAEAAARRLRCINSTITIAPRAEDCTHRTIARLIGPRDCTTVLLDCTDNFETRYLLNDAAVSLNLPLIYAGAVGTSGMLKLIRPRETACLRCLFNDPPAPGLAPTCETAGVFAPLTALLGALQAAEAINHLSNNASALTRGLLTITLSPFESRRVLTDDLPRADCPCCALQQFDWLEGKHGSAAAALCGRASVQVTPTISESTQRLDLNAAAARLSTHGHFTATRFLVRGHFTAERADDTSTTPIELTLFPDGRAIFTGTTKPERARALYARYVSA